MFLAAVIACLLLAAGTAHAGTDNTRYSLDRLEELLELRIEDGRLSPQDVMPAILVSAEPCFEASQDWYATRVIELLERSFGDEGLRLCEACMAPRAFVDQGTMTFQTGPVSLDEVARLDEQNRGEAQAARTAIWLDEHRGGVAIRIVDLGTARVLYAQNVDPNLVENDNTQRMYTLSEELERQARGDSITQSFVDIALYPGQHISIDWTEQWGKTNANLSGVTLSVIDPVAGIGAAHYRCIDIVKILVGGKLLMSLPTAVARSVGDVSSVIDPMVTAVAVVRVPFGRSNYGAVLSASTNGQVAFGISLMNISPLPVLP